MSQNDNPLNINENEKDKPLEESNQLSEENKKTLRFKKKLVMSGGGIRGISHLGSLYALEKSGCLKEMNEFAGTSVGSLIIALFVIGYSSCEIYELIKLFNLSRLKDISFWNLSKYGLDTGHRIEYLIKRLIKEKGYDENITLEKLYEFTKKKVIFTTVCLNDNKICYLSHLTYPDLPLYLSVRMSISLPFYYCPVFYNEKYYIDGGCLNTYPINLFEEDVVGILLVENDEGTCVIDNLEVYIMKVLQCLMKALTCNVSKGYENNTIEIHTEPINLVNFEITSEKIDKLFLEGYNAVIDNFNKLLF